MPLPRRSINPPTLAQMFGLEPEVGKVPSGDAFNRSIRPSIEHEREAGILANMDARAEAGIRRDLEESEMVRAARDRGFTGSYPLQEQENFGAQQKLRQILLPKQMELEAAMLEKESGREFNAAQGQLDRASRERVASGAQAGQTGRVNTQQQAITNRAEQARLEKRSGPRKLYDWLTGNVSKSPQAAATPAAEGNDGQGMVMMEAPTGEQQMVPAGRVQEFIAKGARVIE